MTTLNEILSSIKGLESVNPPANPPRRVLLIGAPGGGKTISSATFPNPVFLELENSLDQHRDTLKEIHNINITDIKRIPMYREEWVLSYLKEECNKIGANAKLNGVLNRRDAVLTWLQKEAIKLPSETTLIVDSWTRIQEAFDHMQKQQPILDNNNKPNMQAFWGIKGEYSEKVCSILEKLPCNVVMICHEMKEWAEGAPTGKLLPLMQGGFTGKFLSYFPDCFRCQFIEDKDATNKSIVDLKTGKKMGKYMWQTAAGNTFDAKCTIVGLPAFVPAQYSSLIKLEKEV